MGEIVNLRQARKRAERARKDAEAETNRTKFGTPKLLRQTMSRERERSAAHLDGHRLTTIPSERDDAPPFSDR